MVTFDNDVYEIFRPQPKRAELRKKAYDACVVQGGTAFYDALVKSAKLLESTPTGIQPWLIALTDGADQHSSTYNLASAITTLRGLALTPNIIIVGIELPQEYKGGMGELAKVTEDSFFIDAKAGLASLDAAFVKVASIMSRGPGRVARPTLKSRP